MRRNNSCVDYFGTNNYRSQRLITQSKKPKISTLYYKLKKDHSPEFKIKLAKKKLKVIQETIINERKKQLSKISSNKKFYDKLNEIFEKLESYEGTSIEETEKACNYYKDYVNELRNLVDDSAYIPSTFFPTSIKKHTSVDRDRSDQKESNDDNMVLNTPDNPKSVKNILGGHYQKLYSVNNSSMCTSGDLNPFGNMVEHQYKIKLETKNMFYPNKGKIFKSVYFIQGQNKTKPKESSDVRLPKINYYEFVPPFQGNKIKDNLKKLFKEYKMMEYLNKRDNNQNLIYIKDKFS